MTSGAGPTRDTQLVVFVLDDRRYALALECVERVLRMVEVAPFPKAPPIISGVLDLHGELVPVVNIRRRFGLAERAPQLSDQLIVARTTRQRVALAVDGVESVLHVAPAEITPSDAVVTGLEYVQGIVRLPTLGIIFVHNLDDFLSLDEATQLSAALESVSA
jgi:purine-binding chemotaxis protein CheW